MSNMDENYESQRALHGISPGVMTKIIDTIDRKINYYYQVLSAIKASRSRARSEVSWCPSNRWRFVALD